MDDVQYLAQDWNNRNRIKGTHGAFWLIVPVRLKAASSRLLKDIPIAWEDWDSKKHWQKIHWRSLQSAYGGTPYWDTYAPFFEELYTRKPWKWLAELNERILCYLLEVLDIQVEFIRASSYGFQGYKSDLVLDHCRKLEADVCVLGVHGREYINEADFAREGVSVFYQNYQHPLYGQRFGEFVSHLSEVDLLFNYGPGSRSVLLSGNISKSDLITAVQQQRSRGVVLIDSLEQQVG